ncbi:MAG: tail fiber domain-containing protein [Candidatus Udaeobacter sp.]
MKTTIGLVPLVLTCLCLAAIAPKAHAVSPPPDGSYPNFTTAEGQNALFSLTTGAANTAIGWYSLFSNAQGSFNTATGAGALLFNTTDQNTAFGAAALLFNTTGNTNTAVGAAALLNDTIGGGNTAIGAQALTNNTSGDNLSGANTAVGAYALFSNTTSGANTGLGYAALGSVLDHGANTAVGDLAGYNITGGGNIAIGFRGGYNLTSGNNNICIGNDVRGVAGENNTIRIGENLPTGAGDSACYIGGIYNQTVGLTGLNVRIDDTGRLGTALPASVGSARDIKPMDTTSEAILALKPVTFHYKNDAKNTPCFGLIAEDVAQVNPGLVVRDKKGELIGMRDDAVNAMLLNEFLKEHKRVEEQEGKLDDQASKIQEQEAMIAELKKEMHVFIAILKAQDSKIQKVSAQVELVNPVPRTAANNP